MVFNQFAAPDGTTASFQHVWSHGGMFPQGGNGFLAASRLRCLPLSGWSCWAPWRLKPKIRKRNLPKAVNAIPTRIILFYVLSLFVVMSVTPWNQIPADRSPFVSLFLHAGIPTSAIIMNLVVLSSVMSSMNSGVFSTSRMLFGLARGGGATGVGDLVKTGSTGQRSAVLLSVYYGRCSLAVFCAEYR
ncbi:amino acid permease [Acinetobacter indicus]